MIKIFLIVYNASGLMIDSLATSSIGKCMELSAKMQMFEFSVPASERFSYDCKPLKNKPIVVVMNE